MIKNMYDSITLEEKINIFTHFPGVILGLIGTIILLLRPIQDVAVSISYIVYGLSFTLIFAASSLYHLQKHDSSAKTYLKKLDHACIYLFIAGSYTPFVLKNMAGPYKYHFLAIVWIIAIFGILYKVIGRYQNTILSLSLYFSFGLMCFLAKNSLLDHIPSLSFSSLVIGALCYTFGVLFYVWKKVPFNHGVWHIFVLMGAISHYIAVYNT